MMADPATTTGAGEDAPHRQGVLARCAAVVRRIIGAPDYAAYVAHVRAHHPEREPLGEREFIAERLNARYEKPGSRCC
jgi:uncharacterized short protein YbdD (DUF466 family)